MAARRIEVLAAVVGAASLGAEIAATRLLAPWFGASTIVWANTIATVLVALSAGYWIGGRLADRDPTVRGLSRVVLVAAALLAAVPFVAPPFLRISVQALDAVQAGAFVGSLVAVLALVAVPVLLLGTVAPYAIRLSVREVGEAGRVSGRLYAISTIGSLVGTFASALLLIPLVGTRRTFLAFAIALALAAVPSLGRRFAIAPVALAALLTIPVGTVKATGGGRVVWERETAYQYARVVQATDGERRLELNEGQAIHSLYRPGTFLTGGYWDELLTVPFATAPRPPRSVAILGNAAGTTARAYGHFFRARASTGSRSTARSPRPAGGSSGCAGRTSTCTRPTRGRSCAARPGGGTRRRRRLPPALHPVLPGHEGVLRARARPPRPGRRGGRQRRAPGGLRRAREDAHGHDALRVPHGAPRPERGGQHDPPGQRRAGLGRRLAAAAPALPPALRPIARGTAARLAPGLRGGDVYTDDRAPVEWLIDASIVQVAADGRR